MKATTTIHIYGEIKVIDLFTKWLTDRLNADDDFTEYLSTNGHVFSEFKCMPTGEFYLKTLSTEDKAWNDAINSSIELLCHHMPNTDQRKKIITALEKQRIK